MSSPILPYPTGLTDLALRHDVPHRNKPFTQAEAFQTRESAEIDAEWHHALAPDSHGHLAGGRVVQELPLVSTVPTFLFGPFPRFVPIVRAGRIHALTFSISNRPEPKL
jgi:hypothetical protein